MEFSADQSYVSEGFFGFWTCLTLLYISDRNVDIVYRFAHDCAFYIIVLSTYIRLVMQLLLSSLCNSFHPTHRRNLSTRHNRASSRRTRGDFRWTFHIFLYVFKAGNLNGINKFENGSCAL